MWPNSWMDEDAAWCGTEVDLGPGHIVLDGIPSSSSIYSPITQNNNTDETYADYVGDTLATTMPNFV